MGVWRDVLSFWDWNPSKLDLSRGVGSSGNGVFLGRGCPSFRLLPHCLTLPVLLADEVPTAACFGERHYFNRVARAKCFTLICSTIKALPMRRLRVLSLAPQIYWLSLLLASGGQGLGPTCSSVSWYTEGAQCGFINCESIF